MGEVVVGVERVDDADPREGEAFLAGEPGELVGEAEAKLMFAAREEGGCKGRDIGFIDGTVSDPAVRSVDLDERLEPEHAPGSVADNARVGQQGREALGNLVGSD